MSEVWRMAAPSDQGMFGYVAWLPERLWEGCSVEANQVELLESIRQSIRNECVSWGELLALQSMAHMIDDGDIELLEWAGVPEND